MTKKDLSPLQKEYREFFLKKLSDYNVNSQAKLTKEKKSEFFTSIKNEWSKIKLQKKVSELLEKDNTITDEKIADILKVSVNTVTANVKSIITEKDKEPKKVYKDEDTYRTKSEIYSIPNPEQTIELKINYTPVDYFEQDEEYKYPVIKMPKVNSLLKLPRIGRTNTKGYKENEFYKEIKNSIFNIEVSNNFHITIPNYNKPFEPDIVLYDKKLNLYIDVEIDEPYDGFYRFPTHQINSENKFKHDNLRDVFFNESGWIVVRFTEKQVHLQSKECVEYLKNIINSINKKEFKSSHNCLTENQWDEYQSINWEKNNYRESYLGILRSDFYERHNNVNLIVNPNEIEAIEKVIDRTKFIKHNISNNELGFDEEKHIYTNPEDKTGNATYISVTTLIDRFFTFDLTRYLERESLLTGKSIEECKSDFIAKRDDASKKGTDMHLYIEKYFKKENIVKKTIKEHSLFDKFLENENIESILEFSEAEKKILSKKYNVAGTVDCIFKRKDNNEYVIFDWKRSKNLIIDGFADKRGYPIEIRGLRDLNNCSYYKYSIQLNLYKLILEEEYGYKISSLKLIILHENYETYYKLDVKDFSEESNIILKSLNHKI